MNADRQRLWEQLETDALEHFHSRRAARRFLGFLRQWGFLGALDAWLASPPSADQKAVMSKGGRSILCGFRFESGY